MSDTTPAPKYTGISSEAANDVSNVLVAAEQYLPARARIIIYPIVHILSLVGIAAGAIGADPRLDTLFLTIAGILETAGASLAIANTHKE